MRNEIRAENLILRKYEKSFVPLLFEAAMESRGGDFSRWMPWCHADYTIEESESFVEKVVESWRNAENVASGDLEFSYAIFDAETGKMLGGIGLNQPNTNYKFYNLGYWVRVSAQNRGVASSATWALAKAAFEDLEINRIEILVAADNIPSLKTAEKAGATREGLLRKRLVIGGRIHDAVMYSFVKDDFIKESEESWESGESGESESSRDL